MVDRDHIRPVGSTHALSDDDEIRRELSRWCEENDGDWDGTSCHLNDRSLEFDDGTLYYRGPIEIDVELAARDDESFKIFESVTKRRDQEWSF